MLPTHPDKTTIRKWSQGVDFLGYVLKPDCTLLRTKTRSRMLKRVNRGNLSSYLGLCSHANSYELQQLIQLLSIDSSSVSLLPKRVPLLTDNCAVHLSRHIKDFD